ncbi:MAG: class C beta-lactamase-related serine hydrolase [Alphaproteobacteria bacterium]|nr:class C beta-lactamase-related serine hydrolase [Alphaproteobacteria bacterium]
MHGFPPAPASQVTLANWRTAPFNVWAFQHVREIVPSADIPNDPGDVWELPSAPADLSGLSIGGLGGTLDFPAFLAATDTDAIVILHRGKIVGEFYANGMTARTPHILMSVSKSILGIVAGILAGKGVLDLDQPVTGLVPEVSGTAWRGATLRQMLDMRAGILFDENYLATSGPIIAYRKSTNWNPLEPGEKPLDLRGFFPSLTESDGPHGGRFHYVSPNTDLLGWAIERAAGERYADLVSRLLWRPMGAATSAYITVDRLGAPRCAGGMCVTARDLARVGQLIVEGGRRGSVEIIPEAWIADVLEKGDRAAWAKGDFVPYYPGMPVHYRSKWYVLNGSAPMLFGLGVNGQNLFVDRKNQIVVAKLSSQAMAMDEARILLTMRGIEKIRAFLAA